MQCIRSLSIAALVSVVALAPSRVAHAFGGSFSTTAAPVTVTDHRVAVAIQPAQTILWDQMRFTGAPTDFAWVLPVHPGAILSLSTDAWFDALEASTQPIVVGGSQECESESTPSNSSGPGTPFGCGNTQQSTAPPVATFVDAGEDTVHVVTEQVVGPYAVATVRASQGASVAVWLSANGYVVSGGIAPTLNAYASAGFDFIALKLKPGLGVAAIQPVRVVTPGSDTTFPLRMLAAGAGANVGIKLFVLSTGRYHPENFPDVTIDPSALRFDYRLQQSNYEAVVASALGAGAGTGWLTEAALDGLSTSDGGANPALGTTYVALCHAANVPASPGDSGVADAGVVDGFALEDSASDALEDSASDALEDSASDAALENSASDALEDSASDAALENSASDATDAGSEVGDAGVEDAGGDAAAANDASAEAEDAATPLPVAACDDLDLATVGTDPSQIWITRLRANLPAPALVADLTLTTTPAQAEVSNVQRAYELVDPYTLCPDDPNSDPGDCSINRSAEGARRLPTAALSFGLIFAAWALRRRKPSRR